MSRVSAHGHLNIHVLYITRNSGPHGHLPGIKIPYVCIEAAIVFYKTLAPWLLSNLQQVCIEAAIVAP